MSKLYRRNDMDTSVEAGEAIDPLRSIFRQRVWEYALKQGKIGFTDRELAEAMARQFHSADILRVSTYRSRRKELMDAGYIVDSGERRTHPPSNRKHAIWRLKTDKDG